MGKGRSGEGSRPTELDEGHEDLYVSEPQVDSGRWPGRQGSRGGPWEARATALGHSHHLLCLDGIAMTFLSVMAWGWSCLRRVNCQSLMLVLRLPIKLQHGCQLLDRQLCWRAALLKAGTGRVLRGYKRHVPRSLAPLLPQCKVGAGSTAGRPGLGVPAKGFLAPGGASERSPAPATEGAAATMVLGLP